MKHSLAEPNTDQDRSLDLEEDCGLKNYMREIVKNANRFGDKLDMTKYTGFVKEYEEVTLARKRGPEVDLEELEELKG